MKKQLALKNSIIAVIERTVITVASLVVSIIFVNSLGVELRGINSTLANVLNLLQLAEMGVGTAVIYALYQPLVDNNVTEIQQLLSFYRKLYLGLGAGVFGICVLLSPLVPLVIHDTGYSSVYLLSVFFIQVINACCTYLCAYKKNLLLADGKSYVTYIIDTAATIIIFTLKAMALVYWHSFVAFLLIQVVYTIALNVAISLWVDRHYPYVLERAEGTYAGASELIANMKRVMVSKIGWIVYSATDNIVITAIVGTAAAGYLAFYYEVKKGISCLGHAVFDPIKHMFGLHVREDEDIDNTRFLFQSYTFIVFCITNVSVVGFVVMINPLVRLVFGPGYVMDALIPILMGADIFIYFLYTPAADFMTVLGYFKEERNASIIAAVMNLVLSVGLAFRIGVAGVLLGTVISQSFLWTVRAWTVYRRFFCRGLKTYVMHICAYILITVVDVMIAYKLTGGLAAADTAKVSVGVVTFALNCLVCVVVSSISILVIYGRTREFKLMMKFLLVAVNNKRN